MKTAPLRTMMAVETLLYMWEAKLFYAEPGSAENAERAFHELREMRDAWIGMSDRDAQVDDLDARSPD